jgi:hypothetical protein
MYRQKAPGGVERLMHVHERRLNGPTSQSEACMHLAVQWHSEDRLGTSEGDPKKGSEASSVKLNEDWKQKSAWPHPVLEIVS